MSTIKLYKSKVNSIIYYGLRWSDFGESQHVWDGGQVSLVASLQHLTTPSARMMLQHPQ